MDNYFIDKSNEDIEEIENQPLQDYEKFIPKRKSLVNDELEVVKAGFANGVAEGFPLSDEEKEEMIDNAEEAFGMFLDALKCNWREDPNSMETPRRVAKAYVNDLWAGRYTAITPITSFPSDGYDGIIIERDIPLTSMCSHHHQVIGGLVHIGYIAGEIGQERRFI